jgi:hypothetical protein
VSDIADAIRSFIQRAYPTSSIAISKMVGFADLCWKPITPKEVTSGEFVRLEGLTRYGVVAYLGTTFRFYAGPLDMNSGQPGILGEEATLDAALKRVLDYVLPQPP